jgi:transposase-like protein
VVGELGEVVPVKETPVERRRRREASWEGEIAEQLTARALEEGVALVGPDGLLGEVVRRVLQRALETEMTAHLGYEWHDAAGDGSGNVRSGSSPKSVSTELGAVQLKVPRDRDGSFVPAIVLKHARRLEGFNAQVLDLFAKGLTEREIARHLRDFYGNTVSVEMFSQVTDALSEELAEWQSRPLEETYAVLWVDCIFVKIRDGSVASRPVYIAIGIDLEGRREVLGLWVGSGGEGARHWTVVCNELRNRGVKGVVYACCDGLVGLPDALGSVWPQVVVQQCIVHMVRSSCRLVGSKDAGPVAKALKTVYCAPSVDAAVHALSRVEEQWGDKYPALIDSWHRHWDTFIPFLSLSPQVRRVLYSTNMIEALGGRIRNAVHRHGHFPNEAAAKKVIYTCVRDYGKSHHDGPVNTTVQNWKPVLNELITVYGERIDLR